ncbi:MAG: diguanylate cyclase [Epsilonproteobacteria bacterium]|nr:diguanylate cyclase [Campylobacterota bacterium]
MRCSRFVKAHRLTRQEQEEVAKIAKKTIAFMSQNKITFTPRNYDEWFYVICKAIEEKHILTTKNLKLLYKRCFGDSSILHNLEEMREISFSLHHITKNSFTALDQFQHNITSHDLYLQESISALDDLDRKRIKRLRLKIAKLEEENRRLKEFLEENRQRLALIEERFREQKKEVELDPLTGVYNRRSFEKDIKRLEESKLPYSLLISDIDNFKQINDTYGHQAGDKVLQQVGEIFTKYVRKDTKTYRYGGEEFVILLLNGDKRAAQVVGERLRGVIENHEVKVDENTSIKFTASFGGTQKEEGESFQKVLERADKALYEAKKLGKNRVVIK